MANSFCLTLTLESLSVVIAVHCPLYNCPPSKETVYSSG